MKAISRRKSREITLQILFQIDITKISVDNAVKHTLCFYNEMDNIWSLLKEIIKNRKQIDILISQNSKKWDINRMPIVDRNILRLGVYELLYDKATPSVAVINEAVELAKKYSTYKSSIFINAVLDAIRKKQNNSNG